jgi:hypothetical protein
MEGLLDEVVLLFTKYDLLVQQNADTSLSCHQNNTNSKSAVANSRVAPDIESHESHIQWGRVLKPWLTGEANHGIGSGQGSPWAILVAVFLVPIPWPTLAEWMLRAERSAEVLAGAAFGNGRGRLRALPWLWISR